VHFASGLPNLELAFISFLSNFLTYLLLTPTKKFSLPIVTRRDSKYTSEEHITETCDRTMAFSNPTIRGIYDFIRPDEKPVEDPKLMRETNFGSNAPQREMQEMEENRME